MLVTKAELALWMGVDESDLPSNVEGRIRSAEIFVRQLTLGAVYSTESDGWPSSAAKRQAFKDAICAQVAYWRARGDTEDGSDLDRHSSVTLGPLTLSRRTGGQQSRATDDQTSSRVSSDAAMILQQAGLMPSGVLFL